MSPIYFYTTLLAYVFGLVFTMFIMHVYRHAQPALLYLVPACLGMPIAISIIRGQFNQLMFEYAEGEDETVNSEENTSETIDDIGKAKKD